MPLETVSVTVWPLETLAPAGGCCLNTVPARRVDGVFTIVDFRPAALNRATAAAARRPVTFGTATFGLPLETSRVTAERRATFDPSAGVWPKTIPGANLLARNTGLGTRSFLESR